jgi:hypothetical protein
MSSSPALAFTLKGTSNNQPDVANAKTYDSAPLSCFNDASAKSATIFNQRNEREKVAGDPQMHKQMRNPCG